MIEFMCSTDGINWMHSTPASSMWQCCRFYRIRKLTGWQDQEPGSYYKCECGADKTWGPKDAEYLHQDWCPKYKRPD